MPWRLISINELWCNLRRYVDSLSKTAFSWLSNSNSFFVKYRLEKKIEFFWKIYVTWSSTIQFAIGSELGSYEVRFLSFETGRHLPAGKAERLGWLSLWLYKHGGCWFRTGLVCCWKWVAFPSPLSPYCCAAEGTRRLLLLNSVLGQISLSQFPSSILKVKWQPWRADWRRGSLDCPTSPGIRTFVYRPLKAVFHPGIECVKVQDQYSFKIQWT